MANVIGIPSTRIADSWVRRRLLAQVQYDQRELFRLETQLSTGRRFQLPSEDPVATLRAMDLQRLLERKEQAQANLTTGMSYLSTTDAAMSQVSGMLAEVRGVALGAIGTVVSEQQRLAAAQQVEQAIAQLIASGNEKFRGRHLFAGSATPVRPFLVDEYGAIEYLGDETRVLSYSDIETLFATNVTGNEVFGAISEPVRGTVDLNPVLTYNTRLADLRAGEGITPGSLAISDGTHVSIVDLSSAETVGDVAELIRANPPEARALDVEITATGLVIQLDSAAGNLSIQEVEGGKTAEDLGILAEDGVGNNPIVGLDLDPILRPTTRLDDILGVRARAVVRSDGADNDIVFEADTRGAALNGVTITFVDDPSVGAGSELVTYDAVGQTIEVRIDEGSTRACHVVDAVNAAHELGVLPFTAQLDPLDEENGGRGLIPSLPPGQATTAGGSGTDFDQTSGLQITSGEQTYTIDLTTAETVEDLLNALNGLGAGVLAEINEDATGINIRTRRSGVEFAIGENGGITATQLGLRTFTADTRLEELNFGLGVTDYEGGADFAITRADGVTFQIDVAGAKTIGDVMDRINNHPDNLAGGVPLVAQLASFGNGIELVDDSVGPGVLTVTRLEPSNAAIHLGLIPEGQESSSAPGPGSPQILTGVDVHPLETEGVFTALIRLQQGLVDNDLWTMQRSIEMLDAQVLAMNFTRAELGARQQGLDVLQTRLDSEDVELRRVLSLEYDADIVEVISNLTARQIAFEAALTATGKIFQMTLMNYL